MKETMVKNKEKIVDKKVIENPDVQIVDKETKIILDKDFVNETLLFKKKLQYIKNICDKQDLFTNIQSEIKNINEFSFIPFKNNLLEDYSKIIDSHFLKLNKILVSKINFKESTYKTNRLFLEHRNYYQQEILDYFKGFELFKQIYYKPFGYAGDFRLINFYYAGKSIANGTFNRFLDEYTINHTLCGQAVQNRKKYIFNKILKHKNILCVGAGPCIELIELVANYSNNDLINFTVIDFDKKAINKLKLEIKKYNNKNINVKFLCTDIMVYFNEKNIKKDYDLIYSLGLFDYFKDKLFSRNAQKLYELVTNNGELIIGNLSDNHPHRSYMALLPEWYLNYRNNSKLAELAEKCNFKNYQITSDQTGVQLYLEVTSSNNY